MSPRHRSILLASLAFGIACADSAPAPTEPTPTFITSGVPDAGRHPYVGFLVLDDANGPAWGCSGSLLSSTVVLTAGHCTDGAVAARIWMTESVEGNSEFPLGGATSYEGTPFLIPGFCILCGNGTPNFIYRDVGIVVLSEPVPVGVVSQYVQLPAAGMVDGLRNKAALDLTGYGVQFQIRGGGPPIWAGPFQRDYAPAEMVSGKFASSAEFLRASANAAKGKGGTCFGDSGGPTLLGGTHIALGVNSFVNNSNCSGTTYSQRIDIPEVLAWIGSFLP